MILSGDFGEVISNSLQIPQNSFMTFHAYFATFYIYSVKYSARATARILKVGTHIQQATSESVVVHERRSNEWVSVNQLTEAKEIRMERY